MKEEKMESFDHQNPTKPTLAAGKSHAVELPTRKDWQAVFIQELAATGIVSHAAKKAGVNRTHLYDVRKIDEQFAENWNEALQDAIDACEAELRRRAVEGVPKPVFWKGEIVTTVQQRSDKLLMFYLQNKAPERFGRRGGADSSGPGGQIPANIFVAIQQVYGAPPGDPAQARLVLEADIVSDSAPLQPPLAAPLLPDTAACGMGEENAAAAALQPVEADAAR